MKNKLSNKYKVPADYFAQMEKEILSKIQEQAQPKVVPLYRRTWVVSCIGVAASLLLIIMLNTTMSQKEVTAEDHTIATEVIYESFFEEDDLDEFTLEDDSLYDDMLASTED